MSARIVRSGQEVESDQGVGIKLPSYAPGPQPSDTPPPVSVELIEYLKKRFVNELPRLPTDSSHYREPGLAEYVLATTARLIGQQDVIAHLGSILKPEE